MDPYLVSQLLARILDLAHPCPASAGLRSRCLADPPVTKASLQELASVNTWASAESHVTHVDFGVYHQASFMPSFKHLWWRVSPPCMVSHRIYMHSATLCQG